MTESPPSARKAVRVEPALQVAVGPKPSAVVALDLDGRITMLSARAEELLQTSAAEALGRSYHEVFGPSLADRVVTLFLLSARTREAVAPRSIQVTLPGRGRVSLRAAIGPIRDVNGVLNGLLFVADEDEAHGAGAGAQGAAETDGRLRVALRRYLGENVASMVERRPSFLGVGGVRQQVSVLHADIRGYTTAAESMEPEDVVALLLKYHGGAITALQAEGGTLDRFIGDSVLAIWNAPAPFEGHPRAALRGALALQAAARTTGHELAYGVGVHTGEAVVGNLGSESYFNYTAVGDTVNVAARLQAMAAAGEILCSDRTLLAAGEGVRSRPLGPLDLKGRREPVITHRIEAILTAGGAPP